MNWNAYRSDKEIGVPQILPKNEQMEFDTTYLWKKKSFNFWENLKLVRHGRPISLQFYLTFRHSNLFQGGYIQV